MLGPQIINILGQVNIPFRTRNMEVSTAISIKSDYIFISILLQIMNKPTIILKTIIIFNLPGQI